ncbi:hypothetical protein [Actinomadura sp. HBU206391]|uniref:hypothetical protein n=1 Tax=Actinomadura sp. HBU206391 TaxID=2731692 RepID=UPI00165045AC|nr:hypothetical protein [Actinomadura sp. HBU206391]MBC6462420.1 hypothetical protein [Actinomadura sp. HBU206391]
MLTTTERTREMFVRRCAFITFWLVLALYVLRHPVNAAHTTKALLHGLAAAADALARLVSAL